MTGTAIVQTPPRVNEYFGVGVTSEPRMASAGVERRMGSTPDKHLPRSTIRLNYRIQIKQSIQSDLCTPHLVRIAVPSTGHPDPIRGYVIHDFAGRDTNKALINYRCCLQISRMTLLKPLFCAGLFSSISLQQV